MLKIYFTLFIIVSALSAATFAYADNGTMYAEVSADSSVTLSGIENLPQFMQSCLTNPASSHLCENVIDVDQIISQCSIDPNSNGLCENIIATGE